MKIEKEVFIVLEWVIDHWEFAEECGIFTNETEAKGFQIGWQRVNGGKYEVKRFVKDEL